MTREEAKELLLNISAYDIDMQRGRAKKEAIEMAIEALEQEPKTGRWEEYGTRQVQILPTYRCSVCGEEYLQSEHFKYCPNCGAKMEVEE